MTTVADRVDSGPLDRDYLRLPHDIRAEQCVLGSMMLSADAFVEVTDLVNAADLYQPAHQTIFETIRGLVAEGRPTHPDAVTVALVEAETINRVGGVAYLHTLVRSVPVAAQAGWYARRVADHAARRRLIEASVRIGQLAGAEGDIADTVNAAQQTLYEATTRDSTAKPTLWREIVTPALEAIEEAANNGGALRGLPTSLVDLDRATNGLQPGQLIVVAGRPGSGKSVFATNLARITAIRHRRPALMCSLEMTQQEVAHRVLSAETGIQLDRVISGRLDDENWIRVGRVTGEIDDSPLHVDDNAGASLVDIRTQARRIAQRGGLNMIIVDYLQLMTPTARRDNRQQEVAEISRGLKLLAKDLQVPVVALAQLNRAAEQRADKRPHLADLRESGALEQDSDVVVLLHRPDYYDPDDQPGEVMLAVAKNRNGPTTTITAAAQLHLARFADMAYIS